MVNPICYFKLHVALSAIILSSVINCYNLRSININAPVWLPWQWSQCCLAACWQDNRCSTHKWQNQPAEDSQCGLQMSRRVGKNWQKHKLVLVSHTTDTLQLLSTVELSLTRSPHFSGFWVWLWFTAWHFYSSIRLITCNLKPWQSDFKESDFRETTYPHVLLLQPSVQVLKPLLPFAGASLTMSRGHSDLSSVPCQADMITAVWMYSAASKQCARCVGEKKK